MMNKQVVSIAFMVSMVGFMVTLLAHIATFFGAIPSKEFLYLWIIGIGLVLIWNPTSLVTSNLIGDSTDEFWTTNIGMAPRWLKFLYFAATVYALFNLLCFGLFVNIDHFSQVYGKAAMDSLSDIIRYLRPGAELEVMFESRTISSYGMVFYLITCATLFKKLNND